MNLVTIFFAFIFAGCSTLVSSGKNLRYDTVRLLSVGKTDATDAFRTFGLPTTRTERNGFYSAEYPDTETGLDRLILNFSSDSNKLTGVFWFPKQTEPENKIEFARATFPAANFEMVRRKPNHPHILINNEVQYIDRRSGVTISGGYQTQTVEAIVMYEPESTVAGKNR